MNKLIAGAKLSMRAAREQKLREAQANGQFPDGDSRGTRVNNDLIVKNFEKHDPVGTKVAELFKAAKV